MLDHPKASKGEPGKTWLRELRFIAIQARLLLFTARY